MNQELQETISYLTKFTDVVPQTGIILGSGLGFLADEIEKTAEIDYRDIPHFPVSTTEGHKGKLILGKLRGKQVLCMQGRFHFYEGYSMRQVVYPIFVMRKLGVRNLIVTNAAGGINAELKAGSLMLIQDHINLMGTNPLIGPNDDSMGPRFPDMTGIYDKTLRRLSLEIAEKLAIDLKCGVYAALTGPSYETPAEIGFLHTIGADAVGMSTVPEAITAKYCGMRVLGISCITNMASGIALCPLCHEEVISSTEKAGKQFVMLLKEVIGKMQP